MTPLEVFYITLFFAAFSALRFGMPILLTWTFGHVLQRLHHP